VSRQLPCVLLYLRQQRLQIQLWQWLLLMGVLLLLVVLLLAVMVVLLQL